METEDYLAYFGINTNDLAHKGVKNVKWGEHHARGQARADANEFAKARAFDGQGAGTKRKLIKAKVETRLQNPHYKAEFESVLSGQNLDKKLYGKVKTAASSKSTQEQIRQFLKDQGIG